MSFFVGLLLLLGPPHSHAAKDIPPAPRQYILDEPRILEKGREKIQALLVEEERTHGNQILVAIFESLEQEDLLDYTNRLFSAWKPGEKNKNNGVLLAVFMKEKKLRIEVGYGNEPYLTDAISKRIIEDEILPSFRKGAYFRGIADGIQSIRNVIHGNGYVRQRKAPLGARRWFPLFVLVSMMLAIFAHRKSQSRTIHGTRIQTNGSGWGGFGGGGGFSGGGGMSGGGGASGSW